MKKLILTCLCVLLALFIVAPANADTGSTDECKYYVIVLDAAGSPPGHEDEPWLMWPCINPEHYYFKPIAANIAAGNGMEPDTGVSYRFERRFIAEKHALGWKPWQNHYRYKASAYWRIEQSAQNGCYYPDRLARSKAKAMVHELCGLKNCFIAIVVIGPTGDERYDTRFLTSEAELIEAIDTAPCPTVRDRADALMRAAIKLNDSGAGEGNCEIIVLSSHPSDPGPYERRLKEARLLLSGCAEGRYISPILRVREDMRFNVIFKGIEGG